MAIQALHLRNDRRLVMVVLAFMLLPVLWYLRTDLTQYASDWPYLRPRLIVRSTLIAIVVAAVLLLRASPTREAYSRIVLGVSLAIALYMVGFSMLQPREAVLPIRTALVNIFLLYVATPNTLWKQLLPALLLSVGIISLRLFWVTSGADGIASDVQLLVIVNVCGVILVRRRIALEQEAQQAWTAEHKARLEADRNFADLRTLRGIIPICAHCKQVRTDVGEWQEVERYVAQHSEAQFSHSTAKRSSRTASVRRALVSTTRSTISRRLEYGRVAPRVSP